MLLRPNGNVGGVAFYNVMQYTCSLPITIWVENGIMFNVGNTQVIQKAKTPSLHRGKLHDLFICLQYLQQNPNLQNNLTSYTTNVVIFSEI